MLIATVVLGLLLPSASVPPEQEIQITGTAGWGGRAVRGEYLPVLIDLDNRGKKDIDLSIAAAWASSSAVQTPDPIPLDRLYGRAGPSHILSVSLPAKSRKRLSLTMLTPDANQMSVWAYATDKRGGILARGELLVRLVEPHKHVVAVVGMTRPEGLEDPGIEIANIQPDELPEEWQSYAPLEALVWMDGRANEIRSSAQVDALRQWISTGGKFCVARSNTVNLAGSPIADLLPVKLGATRELDSLGGGFPRGPVVVLESTVRKGAIRAEASGVPLVVEAAHDAGRVTFAAFNPAHPPFAAWTGAPEFWKWLLDIAPAAKPAPPQQRLDLQAPPRAIGSQMLAQQAGRFPDVAAPEIGGLFLLIILYLVVVGPLDYMLLRWLRRLEYTWFTFPAYVVLFTLFILLVGGAFIQRAAHQREIAIVDYYPESGFVRRHALSAVLAPADVLYRVEDAEPLSSNFIQINDSGGKTTDVRVIHAPKRAAENWLLNRNFTGLALADRCSNEASPLSYAVTSRDHDRAQLVVKNNSGETFENATLVANPTVYTIPAIGPGESTVTATRASGTVEDWLKKEGFQQTSQQQLDEDGNAIVYGRYNNGTRNPGAGLTERELNPLIMKALLSLSFPPARREPNVLEPGSGLARGLQANAWRSAGGTVLLAWPRKPEVVVQYEPKPGRHTSVTLFRFFQGPPP
jgi:hypothetical protein